MQSNSNPNIDPADNDSMIGLIRASFSKLMQDVNGMLPAQVVAFDRTANRVQVQPLIKVITTDGQFIQRAQIASLPVLCLGAGGFLVNFNLNTGDLGWIMANDRDISLFLQSYASSQPNTQRKNNFADALFIPDIMRGYTIASEDLNHGNMVIQNAAGTVKIALWSNKIKIAAPTVEIDAPAVNLNGNTTITAGGPYALIVNANLYVFGNVDAEGTFNPGVPPP